MADTIASAEVSDVAASAREQRASIPVDEGDVGRLAQTERTVRPERDAGLGPDAPAAPRKNMATITGL